MAVGLMVVAAVGTMHKPLNWATTSLEAAADDIGPAGFVHGIASADQGCSAGTGILLMALLMMM